MRKILLLALLIFHPGVFADELSPFTSDGCSAFPDGTMKQQALWLNCCVQHDLAYWKGGTYQERLQADQALEMCVASVGEPQIAHLMLTGVRVGGSPYFPTTYRWGYGWSFGRGYQALSKTDKLQIRRHLHVLELMIETLKKTLRE